MEEADSFGGSYARSVGKKIKSRSEKSEIEREESRRLRLWNDEKNRMEAFYPNIFNKDPNKDLEINQGE